MDAFRAALDSRLDQAVSTLAGEVQALSSEAQSLTDQIATLLTGGKRLRALLAYWSYRAHGGPDCGPAHDGAVALAAALELFQASALFHDDILDAADTRRGHPTAHRAFAALHQTNGWAGEADKFGNSAAILVGDLALVAAQQELSQALAQAGPNAAALQETYNRMGLEVMVGQYLDVQASVAPWGADPAADEARSLKIVTAKAASYSVRYPLVLGALLAGADPAQAQAIDAVGLPLGIAFQLRDDVLGVFGDAATTGKPIGDDLREGKRTVLAARTMSLADAAGRVQMQAALGNPDLTEADVTQIQTLVRDTGAYDSHEATIAELVAQANANLARCHLQEPGLAALRDLLTASVTRNT